MTERAWLDRGPVAPILLAAATAIVMVAVFGSLRRSPVFHDETAYTLQAQVFASGRWIAEARPLPEFFEEIHTFDTPFVAAKYWPGHSLALVPGIWLGLPALGPVVFAGTMGGLLFGLARRIAGGLAALLAWAVWVSAPDNLFYGATYFSELTTGVLWLFGWWALLEWRRTRHTGWLVALALGVGWGAITRPLTMLAFALPAGIVAARDVFARRSFRELVLPAISLAACLAVVPLWSARTTGDWHTTPYTMYRKLYLPVDLPGFTVDSSPPVRPRPWDLEAVSAGLTEAHRAHTVRALPGVLAGRVIDIGKGMWGGGRVVLLPFAVLSLAVWPAATTVAAASAALLVLVHLIYAYEPGWTLYYFELFPVLAFLTAVGMGVALKWVVRRMQSSSLPPRLVKRGLTAMAVIYAACGFFHLVGEAGLARAKHDYLRTEQFAFHKALAPIRDSAAVVFIRYRPDHSPHLSLIDNGPDLKRVRIWEVYDRGADNERLMQRFPERTPYLYDEAASELRRLGSIAGEATP